MVIVENKDCDTKIAKKMVEKVISSSLHKNDCRRLSLLLFKSKS